MGDKFEMFFNTAQTALIIVSPELKVEYINETSMKLLEEHQDEIRKNVSRFDLDEVVGISLRDIDLITEKAIEWFTDPDRKPFSRFVHVGEEAVHVTLQPLIDSNGEDLGTVIEWWYATDYLKMEENNKKMLSVIDVINELSMQANILSLNAAVEAARLGGRGNAFSIIAGEMRDLSQRTSDAAHEIRRGLSKARQ